MLTFMMSLAAHQISQSGSLLDFAHQQRRASNERARGKLPNTGDKKQQPRKKMVVQQPTNQGYKPLKKIPNYQFLNRTYAVLFEPPFACCALWDAAECNCILHPREQPIEYFTAQLQSSLTYLERAYCVDLFVLHKRAELEIRALNNERLEKLSLSYDNPGSEQDSINDNNNKSTGHQSEDELSPKKLTGGRKLCLIHKLVGDHHHHNNNDANSSDDKKKEQKPQPHKWSKTCFLCKTDQVRRRETKACRALYAAYRRKNEEVLERVHKRMNHDMFECNPPAAEPRRELSKNPARKHGGFLRVTSWSENSEGRKGPRHGNARHKAQRAADRQAEVWGRMRGENPVTEENSSEDGKVEFRVLNTIVEDDEE